MPSQLVTASLVDRLRHWRFRALRRAAPVNGRALGITAFLSHRGSSWCRDDRNPSGRPSWLIAGPRRAIRLLGADRLRWRLVLDASDDLGALLVELDRILFERLLLALFFGEERKQMSAKESSSDKTSDRPASHHCGSSRASGLQSARLPALAPTTGLLLTSSRFWHL